ncbi:MAG: efflux RND transporter periplasmic adaptor subunit [Holophagaceae bacterium]|nr:efflux RND transporter periplasmic adaptor subunit [Holophagaceae bacterium]
MKPFTPLALALLLAVPGCDRFKPRSETGVPERPGLAQTLYTGNMELFAEFPVMAVGEPSAFAAHLSRLSDFKPVQDGKVTVILSGGGPEERFETGPSKSPGIFRPEAKPKQSGKRQLALLWEGPQGQERFNMGTIEVYPSLMEAMKAPEPEHPAGGVSFLKEQQWSVDFATATAEERTVRANLEAFGKVVPPPDGEARLQAPVAGRIEAKGTYPYVGMNVKRGQVLAYVMPRLGSEAQPGLLSLEAERAKVRLERAKQQHQRMKGLFATESVSRRRMEEAAQDEALAQAEWQAMDARLKQFQEGVGGAGSPLVSPISGTLAAATGGLGSSVVEGQELFHIVSLDHLWLEVQVPESEAGRLKQPSGIWFEPQGMDQQFELSPRTGAKFMGVGSAITPDRRTLPFLVSFPNQKLGLRAGVAGKVRVFLGETTKALAIPASALQEEDGLATVYVQTGGERFERRILKLGVRDGEYVQVLSGLQKGERVATRGAHLVRLAASAGKVPQHGHAH